MTSLFASITRTLLFIASPLPEVFCRSVGLLTVLGFALAYLLSTLE